MNEDLIELVTICKQYFGITPDAARRRAALGTLPIAAFRLSDTGRGPVFVRKADLENLIEARAAKAKKLNSQMQSVGAV